MYKHNTMLMHYPDPNSNLVVTAFPSYIENINFIEVFIQNETMISANEA